MKIEWKRGALVGEDALFTCPLCGNVFTPIYLHGAAPKLHLNERVLEKDRLFADLTDASGKFLGSVCPQCMESGPDGLHGRVAEYRQWLTAQLALLEAAERRAIAFPPLEHQLRAIVETVD